MTNFALMFNVLEGGIVDPIKWSKDNFLPNTSIIVLDEDSECVYLWHGVQQGLVARRTALRQADSIKGHGYTIGRSIIGRDIKSIKEIDARKVGKVPIDTELNQSLQDLLDKKFTELDNFTVTFQAVAVKPGFEKTKVKPKPKVEVKSQPAPTPKPIIAPSTTSSVKSSNVASEYEDTGLLPSIKQTTTPSPAIEVSKLGLETNAKVSFVFSAILEHFSDIWISKKQDGSYSVEEMDGPICAFHLKAGSSISFTVDSFSRIDPKIKTAIQKKFIELSKLI
ncbi:hypothetical protein LCGC14_1683140 [marine sediment metagenome]|uniref:Uncharacterized protein n=1 Tax=marine sediment metagenome TaxID=412755 RepID=A0A0F9K3J5_9ZZZZ